MSKRGQARQKGAQGREAGAAQEKAERRNVQGTASLAPTRVKDRFNLSGSQRKPPAGVSTLRVPTPGRWILSLLGLFFATRLFNLTLAGPGYDEATYLYWGHVIAADWGQRFIGAAAGGKQPLHAWLVALSERVIADPILAGRLVSAFSGALAMVALWLLAKHLFSVRVAKLSALLYVLCSFTLLYDRVAYIDGLLTAESLWMLYLSVRLVGKQEWPSVVGLALSFGAALLTKSVGVAFIVLMPAALVLARREDRTAARLYHWGAALFLALAGGYVIYWVVFGSSTASAQIGEFERNYGNYTMSLSTLLSLPWQTWGSNAGGIIQWFYRLVTIPLSLVCLAAVVAAPQLGPRAWLMAAWAVLPILGQALVAARFYDRYILFSIPPLLVLTAHLLDRFGEWLSSRPGIASRAALNQPLGRALATAVFVLLLIWPIVQDIGMLVDQKTANDFTGGFLGLRATRNYLAQRAATNPVFLVVNTTPGPVEDGLAASVRDLPGVKVLRVAPMEGKLTIFDPFTRQGYARQYFQGKEAYYGWYKDAETKSWLAGHVTPVQAFPNMRGDDENDYIGLYSIRFDDSFR